jgi:DNA damage-binding protein 2
LCEHLLAAEHPRVISAANFSPLTGHSILTTCGDNRLRIWDQIQRFDEPPVRELVHSHDFNRYLSPFKAVWDPKDATERTVVIGRYIGPLRARISLYLLSGGLKSPELSPRT